MAVGGKIPRTETCLIVSCKCNTISFQWTHFLSWKEGNATSKVKHICTVNRMRPKCRTFIRRKVERKKCQLQLLLIATVVPKCMTERHRKSFPPVAIKLYNSSLQMALGPFHLLRSFIFILQFSCTIHFRLHFYSFYTEHTFLYTVLCILYILFLLMYISFIYIFCFFTSMFTRSTVKKQFSPRNKKSILID